MSYSLVYLSFTLPPLPLSSSGSVQEPSMQGVQISDSGQQVDVCAGTNGGVHSLLQCPQTAALALHSGGHDPVGACEDSDVLIVWT